MNSRGIKVSNGLIIGLHKEILTIFSKHYSIETKTLTVFQLYGFGDYNIERPSLKGFITEITGQWINGKYLYNKIREVDKGNSKYTKLRITDICLIPYLLLVIYYNN